MASVPFSRSLLFLLCFANCHCQDAGRFPLLPSTNQSACFGSRQISVFVQNSRLASIDATVHPAIATSLHCRH
uniref:Putative secreted protein n=1 Tax=Anopheles darlingi TaxID=43151 RepID=A0A2M4DHP0_ANODA